MAESTKVDACEGCGERPSTTNSFQERRSACSPAQATWHCQAVSTGRTPGPLSAHPGNAGSPPAAGQGHLGPPCPQNVARERSWVRALRQAFLSLQATLPAVPPGTKLSKLDVLVLATSYIAHLSHALGQGPPLSAPSRPLHGHPLLHPLKKWPMRSRLYTDLWGGAWS